MQTIDISKKAEYLSEKLKSEIVSGGFEIDSKFFSIPQMAKKFNVSPVTAHKAATNLVKQGYLRSVARKGYFVSAKPNKNELLPMFSDVATRRILFIVKPEDMGRTSPKVISGLQPVCIRENCRIEVVPANAPDIVEQANSSDVAGVILEILDDFPEINLISKPKICIGRWPNTSDEVASFVGDIEEAMNMTVEYFHRFGHERISMLIGKSGESINEPMLSRIMAGYMRGHGSCRLGWEYEQLYVEPETEHHELVRRFVREFRYKGITSVFILHWSTLVVLLQELSCNGLGIPEDLSVIVYGESEFTGHVRPKMTRFELHITKIARQAAETIFNSDKKTECHAYTTLFPVELLEGESVRRIDD